MIPNHAQDRTLNLVGATATTKFGLSIKNSSHLMNILRDTMYSDRILAVLREYSANAWDAHRDAGKADLPIKITLPTPDDYTLTIRDYGNGLSHEGVFEVFTQYGDSTKRETDDAVGMLGIGSKSAFAYSDSFTITTCHGGVRRVYIAVLDESNCGLMNLMHEEPCDEETGVEIKIAVKPSDVGEFATKARKLFQHMEPRPDINTTLPATPPMRTKLPSGYVDFVDHAGWSHEGGEWYAVMGCVPYRIRLESLDLCDEHKQILARTSGVLPFKIGALQISASREELRYTPMTKNAIIEQFTNLVDEFVHKILSDLENSKLSLFEQRVKCISFSKIGFDLPGDWESYAKAQVRLFDDADKSLLYLVRDQGVTNSVQVTSNLCLLIDDTNLDLRGYMLSQSDYVVRMSLRDKDGDPIKRKKGQGLTAAELATLKAQLQRDIDACFLTGVPVKLLSEETWNEHRLPAKARRGATNPKHRATMFEYLGTTSPTRSNNWEVVQRAPTDDDVFVVIQQFEAYDNFQRDYREDMRLMTALGLDVETVMPTVYGYKYTDSKPVDEKNLTGRDYRVWREAWRKSLNTPELHAMIEQIHWAHTFAASAYYLTPEQLNRLAARIGEDNLIVQALRKGKDCHNTVKLDGRDAVLTLGASIGFDYGTCEAKKARDAIQAKYPLFNFNELSVLWKCDEWSADAKKLARKRIKAWVHYVVMMDQAIADDVDDDDEDHDRRRDADALAS